MFWTRPIRIFPNSAYNLEILHEIWSFDSQLIYRHQMSDFKAKMHQIQFAPGPAGGAYSTPQTF